MTNVISTAVSVSENNKSISILWLSRHEMTEEQKQAWINLYGNNIKVYNENVTWQATEDEEEDYEANTTLWNRLVAQYHPVVILGVFPPVCLESVNHRIPMYSPISLQNAKTREDGTRQIEFVHVRWSKDQNKWNWRW